MYGDGIDPELQVTVNALLDSDRTMRRTKPGLPLRTRRDDRVSPTTRRERHECCNTDVVYDVVAIRDNSRLSLKRQEDVALLLDVGAFTHDYLLLRQQRDELCKKLEAEPFLLRLERSETHKKTMSNKPRRFRRHTQNEIPAAESVPADPNILKKRRRTKKGKLYWSARTEYVYYRSIECSLHEDKTAAVMDASEVQDELQRFLAWMKREKKAPLPFELTPETFEAARSTAREWREAVYADLETFDQLHRIVKGSRRVMEKLKERRHGFIAIQSRFDRVVNRRFQPRDFWPHFVSPKNREGARNESSTDLGNLRRRWFWAPGLGGEEAQPLVGLDMSSSQTQIMALLLGLRKLEEHACSSDRVPFKEQMAKLAWAMHESPKPGSQFSLRKASEQGKRRNVKDYEGPEDSRLQDLCKTLWMRVCYGSKVATIVHEQSKRPKKYGPGWTRESAQLFLDAMFGNYPDVAIFLKAGRQVASLMCARNPSRGLTLRDPYDGALFRWDPLKRVEERIPNGRNKVSVLRAVEYRGKRSSAGRQAEGSGESATCKRPKRSGEARVTRYRVDASVLRRRITPCIIHMLDAYLSALVMDELYDRGVRTFVGIHDCWLVPRKVQRPNGVVESGLGILNEAIKEATAKWYGGLGPVLSRLCHHLATDGEVGPFIRKAYQDWKERLATGYRPAFRVKGEEEQDT
jgi:hypothetical protein